MFAADPKRRFAEDVVSRLRESGFEAYLAGGCVRDLLLGHAPKDYDVATNAMPPQVRELFGRRRTLSIGASFGVITVIGPKPAGTVEVATFRQDLAYSDGRHPDQVVFTTAEEDAQRRDFTINGLFLDPADNRVIDFVGGQEDLKRRVIRAIREPHERFSEDKLRMLRAVRFAATLGFTIDPATREAIRQMACQIGVVSAERIAAEMRRLLVGANRVHGVQLLFETNLAATILPEIVSGEPQRREEFERALAALGRLHEPSFSLAMATLLGERTKSQAVVELGQRWRLSNKEIERAAWLVDHRRALWGARSQRWSQLQPIIAHDGAAELLALTEAAFPEAAEDIVHCRAILAQPREEIDPPPLVTGTDLITMGIPPGPRYSSLLRWLRESQLDGEVRTKPEALVLAQRLLDEHSGGV